MNKQKKKKASARGHESIIRLLLDRRANTSTTGFDGRTPFHVATEKGYEAVARLLVDRGVNA